MDLRTARKNLNYTQHELADLVGVTHASISNYETGRSAPAQDIKHRIEAVLGQEIDWDATAVSVWKQALKEVWREELPQIMKDYFEYVKHETRKREPRPGSLPPPEVEANRKKKDK